jgi:hypothetical protein
MMMLPKRSTAPRQARLDQDGGVGLFEDRGAAMRRRRAASGGRRPRLVPGAAEMTRRVPRRAASAAAVPGRARAWRGRTWAAAPITAVRRLSDPRRTPPGQEPAVDAPVGGVEGRGDGVARGRRGRAPPRPRPAAARRRYGSARHRPCRVRPSPRAPRRRRRRRPAGHALVGMRLHQRASAASSTASVSAFTSARSPAACRRSRSPWPRSRPG